MQAFVQENGMDGIRFGSCGNAGRLRTFLRPIPSRRIIGLTQRATIRLTSCTALWFPPEGIESIEGTRSSKAEDGVPTENSLGGAGSEGSVRGFGEVMV